MRQRLAATTVLILVLAAAACGGPAAPTKAAAAPPDPGTVVLVTIDTLRADRVGCYGRKDAGTPALDRLAAQGARFALAQTTAPLTLPAHASILTGRTVPAHGVLNNGTFALAASIPTLAESFSRAGWDTGAFVSSLVLARRYGLARGFGEYDDRVARGAGKTGIVIHYDERPGPQTVAAALGWLGRAAGHKAFVWVHLWEPHAPYTPPAEFAQRFASDRYQGEVAAADAALGQLLDGLTALGRGSRLTVAVISDHGEGLGEHGEPTHGVFLYRATMQVPLVLSSPGAGVKPQVVDAPVGAADLAPTLAALAGVPAPAGADGVSLAAGLTGKGPLPARDGVFAESYLPRIEFAWSGLRAFVSTRRKLIDAPRPELFHIDDDPTEAHDRAADDAGGVRAARESLDAAVRRAAAAAPGTGGAERSASEQDLDALRSLGYASSGRKAAAGDLVEHAGTDPKDRADFIEAHDRAVGWAREGRPAEAIQLFEQLARREPKNPSLLFQMGQAQITAGRLDDALATYRRLAAADPGSSLAWYRIGQILDNRRDGAGAEAAYRRAVQADPLALDPRKALGSLLAQQGKTLEAIDQLQKVKDLDPDDASVGPILERLWAKTRQ